MGLILQTVPENYCKSAKIEIAKIKQYCRLQYKILNHQNQKYVFEPRLSLHKKRVPMRTLFLWKKDKEAKKPEQKWAESTHIKASLTSALGEE